MSEFYTDEERYADQWAKSFDNLSASYKDLAKDWADRRDFSMALRCQIFSETYQSVGRQMRQTRNCRLEGKEW